MAAVEAGRAFVQYGMIDKATENIYIRTADTQTTKDNASTSISLFSCKQIAQMF